MDFVQIKKRYSHGGAVEIYPDFIVKKTSDLLIKGSSFYAIWDEENNRWSTNEYDVQRLVDDEIYEYAKQYKGAAPCELKLLSEFSSNKWVQFQKYTNHQPESNIFLDEKVTFHNSDIRKEDYVSKRLSYNLEEGDYSAYDELIGTLYDSEERQKLEWAIGAIITGDAKTIQKFIVLYGAVGAGKSTVLNIIQKLFEGYYTSFDAKALTSNNNSFATETFRDNPLVVIQHDGDLSRIEDNTKLNSIVSHEDVIINEKHKSTYIMRPRCFLFLGTNKPVKITDSKSGIIRRLIDVRPSGKKIPVSRYDILMNQINFELGAIAYHCLEVYQALGKNYYNNYKPLSMMFQTDAFFNFMENYFDYFLEKDGVSLTSAYEMYKQYCNESLMDFKLPRYKFREELKNYFERFYEITRIDGKQIRSYYEGFLIDRFKNGFEEEKEVTSSPFVFNDDESILDNLLKDCPAQYAVIVGKKGEIPTKPWDEVKTTLDDIDTKKVHFVKPPENHIVIDFDLKEGGQKSFARNLEAITTWPATYAEVSKGGEGIHLHYIYDGDVSELSSIYEEDIEIKVFKGKSSLRRRVSKCNNAMLATLKTGSLPLKKVKKILNEESIKSEKALRSLILRNLRKEIHAATKPSCDFIYKILEDTYSSGLSYDVTDMRTKVLTFALRSTNQSDYCIELVNKMHFKSEESSTEIAESTNNWDNSDTLVFFDIEVFPNLLLVNWKYDGSDTIVRMINPSAEDIEDLCRLKLVGFNNLRYDNIILYARMLGYDNQQIFELSQKIIDNNKNVSFYESRNLSYTDIYDFSSAANKKSLKKWEIELGLHHQELDLPWDEPVPEERWREVSEYCDNDVIATEAVFYHLSEDYLARLILADLAEMTPNDTTNNLTKKIIFGTERNPKSEFQYRNLAEPVYELLPEVSEFLHKHKPDMMNQLHGKNSLLPYFPGYRFEAGHSYYKGEDVLNGGWAWSLPGLYFHVGLLDVESQHPNTMIAECIFGPRFTERFCELVYGRLNIKHEEWGELNDLLDGKLTKYVEKVKRGELTSKGLANALKTAINCVYGLTSASFDNIFKDARNIDNVVAKRGALFMVDLKEAVEEQGYTVMHIKTDSIKIANVTPEIIAFVKEFGKRYGYTFDHEATYDALFIANKADYVARYRDKDGHIKWTSTGDLFSHPYVFKNLFSKEPVLFDDLCEVRSVKTSMYLNMNEDDAENNHYVFVGRVGQFCPMKEATGGGILLRKSTEDKYDSVNGTKGYRWLEAEVVQKLSKQESIELSYFDKLVNDARDAVNELADFEQLVSDDVADDDFEYDVPCLTKKYQSCIECPYFNDDETRYCKLGYYTSKQIPKSKGDIL